MNRFSRIRHHVDMKDVKKRHLEESSAKKLEEKRIKEEIEQINSEYEKQKSDWREELDLKESDWTPVDSPITNSTSQTFHYSIPNLETGEPNTFTVSGLGGVESLPSSVEVDFGFNENPPGGVNPPSYDQLALAGYAKPILMKRRDTEDVNPRLDASQEFAQNVGADVMMNARVDNEKDDSYYYDRHKSGYYTEKLGPVFGAMSNLDELKMNERLVKEGEREHEIYKKNIPIIQAYNKKLENIVKPLLAKLNSGSEKKMKLKEFIRTQAGATDDGTYGVLIRHEGKNTVIYTYNGKNISPVGVGERGQPGMYGQGTMNSDRKLDYPKRIKYEMPEDLQKWQAQAIDPSGAISRSAGSVLAKLGNVESAFNLVNYYIDNHVMGMYNQNFDPTKRHNVTSIFDNKTKDILRKGMDQLKPQIDAKIKLGKLVNQSKPDLQKEIRDLVDNYFAHGGAGKSSRDIFNSLGNALGFNLETYMKTGNYQFDSTYLFTSTLDMGIRGKLGFLSGASRKYVSGQLYGETMMAVQNPMQFQVDIESGRQYTEIIDKRGRVTKPADPEPETKPESKTMTKRKSLSLDQPIVRRKKES